MSEGPPSKVSPEQAFTIEIATASHDLVKITSVINAAYKKARFLRDDVERVSPEELRSIISTPHKKLYLYISVDHTICGTALLDFCDKDKAEISLFAIHPDYQGKNIGPPFLNDVEKEAFKKVSEIILKVIPLYQEQLIKFYERLGYTMTSLTIEFPEEEKLRTVRPECWDRMFFSIMHKVKL
jgi:N-acetylglutamate synthase-like GNAT family acetyltransferase